MVESNNIANARWNGPFEEFGKVMESGDVGGELTRRKTTSQAPITHYGLTTIEQVLNDRIINEAESQAIMKSATERLRRIKMDDLFIGRYD